MLCVFVPTTRRPVGREEQVLEQQADEDRSHPAADVVPREDDGGRSDQRLMRPTFPCFLFLIHLHFIF